MAQALAQRQVEQRKRMVPAIAVQEGAAHLDGPDLGRQPLADAEAQCVNIEALHDAKIAAHQHGVAHAEGAVR